jgi:tetrahydromethanopterin S-methyltransferase subunit G
VTKSPDTPRCGWCHRLLPLSSGSGRPRLFCSRSHRQRAYEARRRADALEIPLGQTIVAESDLQRLHDRLYRLESAVQDVDADLADRSGARAYREALDHLLEAARDLVGVVIGPVRP